MKYIVLTLVTICALSIQAAYQFNDNVIVESTLFNLYETYLTFDQETELSLKFDKRVAAFGYYNLDTNQVIKGTFTKYDRKHGVLGTFDKGDRIGIWVKKLYGFTYTTTINAPVFGGIFHGIDRTIDPETQEVSFVIGSTHKLLEDEWALDGVEFEIIDNYTDKATGQPLPGMLATLLATSVCFGIIKYKKL